MICADCGQTKPASEFYDSIPTYCKKCWCIRVKERRRNNPAVQEYDRERSKLPDKKKKIAAGVQPWRKANPDKWKAQCAINNAIRDGRLSRPSICEACGQRPKVGNVRRIAVDPAEPLKAIRWRCALCQHRERFEAVAA